MTPKDFNTWQDCITNKCGIPLTADFAAKRLVIYKQTNHPETLEFIRLYGAEHHKQIVKWFEEIKRKR